MREKVLPHWRTYPRFIKAMVLLEMLCALGALVDTFFCFWLGNYYQAVDCAMLTFCIIGITITLLWVLRSKDKP